MLERAAQHTIVLCFSGRFEASFMKIVFVELDDQPITNRKVKKARQSSQPPARAIFKSAIMEVQTTVNILLSSESSS